ncbi:unnamed protein product [Lota lota]
MAGKILGHTERKEHKIPPGPQVGTDSYLALAGVAMQQSPHQTCGSDHRPGSLLLFKDMASLMALSWVPE